jgi:uncharacterized protein (DUF58 family)
MRAALWRWLSPPAEQQRPAGGIDDGEGVVRVSSASLIALSHGAESLPLKSSRIRALQSGGYISPFKGRGMEFDEVRPYMPGDDARTLDWRVTARSGRPHTKLFREERERAVLLWLDLRQPMFFATRGAYKAVRAAQAATLIGWSAVRHGDRLGALLFDEHEHQELRPRRGRQAQLHFIQRLCAHPAWGAMREPSVGGDEAAEQSLLRLRRVAQPGSLVFLISDFLQITPQAEAQLMQLGRHVDIVMLSLYDALEEALPSRGRYRVGDGQHFASVDAGNAHLRARYHAQFLQRREAQQALCRRLGGHWLPLGSHEDPLAVLQRGLGGRR